MTSVGPPGGNPTTTRTGRCGYPCANDGATPLSSSTAVKIPCKTRIAALSLNLFLLAQSSASAPPGTRPKRRPSYAGTESFEKSGHERKQIGCAWCD